MDTTLRYTLLGFNVTALLDRNESIDPDETAARIDDGSLFEWLKERFGEDIDLSLHDETNQKEVLDLFSRLSNAVDAKRNFAVQHNGLALLAAYCFEGLQEMHYPKVK